MPMVITKGGAIPNYYNPNKKQQSSAQDVIAKIDYADLWRGPGTLHDDGVMRVDMQGNFRGPGDTTIYNIQVQVDGVNGNSTVAHVNVSSSIQTNDPANQRGAANKAISALNQSLDNGHSYTLNGTNP